MTKTQVITAAIARQKRIREDLTQAAHLVGMAVVDGSADQVEPLARLADLIYANRASVDLLIGRLSDALVDPAAADRITLGAL